MPKQETLFNGWWIFNRFLLLQDEAVGLREIARAGWNAALAIIEQGSDERTVLLKFRSAVQDFMLSRLAIDCNDIEEVEAKYPELAKALIEVGIALKQRSNDEEDDTKAVKK